jgi:hypothetical protein
LQWRELEKFIALKVDNRSERIGVIHDDAVTKVNRKTKAGEARTGEFEAFTERESTNREVDLSQFSNDPL